MISIIIPSFEPKEYIYRCLDSIRNQTIDLSLLEVIVVLNGSKKPYLDDLKEFINKMQNLRILLEYCEIAHVSAARNLGLSLASGDFVAFMDDDDFISEFYFEGLMNVMVKNRSAVVFSNVLGYNENSGVVFSNYLNKTFEINLKLSKHTWMSLRSHMSVVWGKLFPKEILENKFFDLKFKNGQDAIFMALIHKEIKNYSITDINSIYYWTERKESASRVSQGLKYEIKNATNLMLAYTKIYFRDPFKNSPIFFLLRILAVLKRLISRLGK